MPKNNAEYLLSFPTGWGIFTGLLREDAIVRLNFPGQLPQDNALMLTDPAVPISIRTLAARFLGELCAYLAGERTKFTIPTEVHNGPEFYRRVWQALRQIPYGQTTTYAALAARVGSPRAARAVGQACGANPLPLLIPCHRVLAAHGTGGFSAGARWKIQLLELEAR